MSRSWTGPLALGLGLLLALLLVALIGVQVMPSYLAAWLFALSVPTGALLLVCGLEAMGAESVAVASWLVPLRMLLPLLPLAALCGLPVLLFQAALFDPARWPAVGIGQAWFARTPVSLRMVLILPVWSALALAFARPRRRPAAAGAAFALMLVTGTLAAFDWTMAVEPGLASSSFGLLVLAGQALSGLAVAALIAPPAARPGFGTPLLVLLAVWVFLHFSQFLVVWSANKPAEATWYLERIQGLGAVALWLGTVLILAGAVLLLPRWLPRPERSVAFVAALALLVRLIESFWLVTPAFRGRFTVNLADPLALVGLVALLVGLSRMRMAFPMARLRHVRH